MVKKLRTQGHELQVLFSGRKVNELWDVDDFKPYIHAEGLSFAVSKGKINLLNSIVELKPAQFLKDVLNFDVRDFELVITDFEPVSAWIAKWRNIPSIGLGHQYAFHYDVPMTQKDLLGKLIIQNYAPVDIPLGLHWHHFNQPVLPPIVPDFQSDNITTVPNKILVYLPFEENEHVFCVLEKAPDYDFYFYTNIPEPETRKNIRILPFSRLNFLNDLHSCEGVICNSGFELPSEALRLGKKLLVKPLKGQMEQSSNAVALQQLRLGSVLDSVCIDPIKEWLKLPAGVSIDYPDVSELISEWVAEKDFHNTDDLIQSSWKNVNLPSLEPA